MNNFITRGVKSVVDDSLNSNPSPIYKLEVDGTNITSRINNRLISLKIKNKRGLEIDTLDLELSDQDGKLEIPPKDANIAVWIGYSTSGLVYKGNYIVKEVEHSGPPDVIHIRATSADMKASLKQKKERSFDNITLEALLTLIALEQNLELAIDPKLADEQIVHLDQNESDANLLTRLSDEYDAIATIKNNTLLFLKTGESKTASGKQLPTMWIERNDGDQHRYSFSGGGEDITGVKAFYYDATLGKKLEVIVGDQSNQNIKELRHLHRDKDSAERSARAKLKTLRRSAATISYKLAKGDPTLIPEMTFLFYGFKSDIDDTYWLGTSVTDTFDSSRGYTTDLTLEVWFPDADDVAELFEDQFEKEKTQKQKWTGVAVYYQEGTKAVKLSKGDQSHAKQFTYLYYSKLAAQQRLDREYSLLDLETGKFKAHNQLDLKAYTGLKTYYTTDHGKTRHLVTYGDQSNAKVIDRLYHSKKAAEKRLQRDYPRLQAKQDVARKIKT
ncbi:contractile injection system protein, VgrG/Pvc8 family [Acinetobacter sp. HY1485]|uniref:contractile injection system protein, VgrG/Pvc8 family n=1 Tax=Acinetobacter sp. HY1485 TaxID=2970918 RepID=UPI0022B9C32B|nr:contractile injection system protein, VgrG/Pvc8 family [Acinetobacter sp. HY1485]